MRVQLLTWSAFACLGAASAFAQTVPPVLSAKAAADVRDAAVYNGPRTKVAMWIWSDKYTYQAGQKLTLKWTVKTNGDLYPYTVLVYRQNNQTGAKTYLPAGNPTPTDADGNGLTAGFRPTAMADAAKATLAL